MAHIQTGRWAVLLSIPLILFMVAASGTGVALPSIYAGEPRIGAAQATGSDWLNLTVVVPTLIVATVFTLRGWMGARLVWAGTVLYVVYDFVYYTLTSRFNSLFLVYCAVLGLAFYGLLGVLASLSVADIAKRYTRRLPAVATAILFLLITLGATINWIRAVVPAVLSGEIPQGVRDAGQLTEPAAVLDLAFVLPGLTIVAILLLRRQPLGFVFGPILLVFVIFVALLLTAMGTVMESRGFGPAFGGKPMNLGLAAVGVALLVLFLCAERRAETLRADRGGARAASL